MTVHKENIVTLQYSPSLFNFHSTRFFNFSLINTTMNIVYCTRLTDIFLHFVLVYQFYKSYVSCLCNIILMKNIYVLKSVQHICNICNISKYLLI